MKTPNRRPLAGLVAGLMATAFLVSCDAPTRPPTEGSIAPLITFVRADAALGQSAASDLTAVTVFVTGPDVSRSINLVKDGASWRGTVNGLPVGTYSLRIEGRDGSAQIIYYGRENTVNVVRGTNPPRTVVFAPTVSAIAAPTLDNTTSYTQTIRFPRIPGASSYLLQWSQNADFSSGVSQESLTDPDTSRTISVNAPGQWFVRMRASFAGVTGNVPTSPTASWTVVDATGGNDASSAQPIVLVPQSEELIQNRNISSTTKSQDWFDIEAVAGDTVRLETFAQRLSPPSPLNTVLSLFRADGTTPVTSDDNGVPGSTDSRIAVAVANTETYKLRVTGAGGSVGHYELRVQIRRLPTAPTTLSATVISGTQVNLAWVDVATNETGYVVDRCAGAACDPTGADSIAFLPAGSTSYDDTGMTPGSYRWRVRAVNAVGSSIGSPIVAAVNVTAALPTGLTANTLAENRIALAWNDVAINETGYEVERCTGVDCGAPFSSVRLLPAGTEAWVDSSVVYGASYSYRVRALAGASGSLNSAFTDSAVANTFPPDAATGLTATTVGPQQIELAWTNVATNATGYRVERCDTDACTTGFTEVASLPSTATNYTDTDIVNDAGYGYRVRAFNVIVSQETSNIANADTRPPAVVTGLVATTLGATSIGLTWADNASNELRYVIERCETGACTFAAIDSVAADVEAFTDNGVAVGTEYAYRIVAVGIAGNSTSAPSNANTFLPNAPTGLVAQTLSATLVRLTWADESNNETQWEISRCTGAACAVFTAIDTIPAGGATYDDTTTVVGQQYNYQVRALNVAGASGPSNSISASTILPPTPADLTTLTVNATRIDLSWTLGAGVADTVRIERCVGDGCTDFVEHIKSLPSLFSAQDTEVTLGNVYTYRARTQNAAGFSAYSPIAVGRTTVPAAPTTLAGRAESATSISLTWVDNANDETSYSIERCDVGDCSFAAVASQGAGTQAYLNTGLTADTIYQFRVRALNAAGGSDFSNIVTIATKVPRAPEALVAQALPGIVRLTWADSASNDEAAVVERCDTLGCGDFVKIADLPGGDQTTFDDPNVALSNNYRYRVRYSNGVGESANSVEASVSTFVPNAPSGLTAQTVSATRVDLTWTDESDNESGFRVERCSGNGCATFAEVGSVGTGITLYQDASVTLGNEYSYRIVAVNVLGESTPSGTALANTLVPSAPTTLTAQTQPGNQIGISWAHDGLNVERYNVLRCTGASCTPTDSITSTIPGVLAYTDIGLANGLTFRYVVQAVNAAGASAASNVAEAATNYPADPVILTADPISPTRIRITWQDNADNEDGYVLERCIGAGCASGFQNLAFLAPNATTFEDEDDLGFGAVTTGAYYGYRVRAFNGAGQSRPTDVINVRTFAPDQPTEALATVLSSTNIRVTWTDQSDNEVTFRVERCAGSDSCVDFAPVASLPENTVEFSDTDVVVNQTYRYRIVAVNPVGDSPASDITTANTLLPDAPASLVVTTQSASQVALTWDDIASNETVYRVERCDDVSCTTPVVVATLAAGATSFQDATVSPEATYCYRVVAENIAGKSGFSTVECASTALPAAPTALSTLVLSSSSIRVEWADNSSDESGFKLERCAGPGCGGASFSQITTIAPNQTSFDDTGLALNTQYRYRLRAFNAAGNTAYTDIVGATISLPTAPSALNGTIAGTTAQLSWTDGAINEASFLIERCDSPGCVSFVVVGNAPANPANGLTTFDDVGAPLGSTLRYRVRAANAVGFSGYTAILDLNTDDVPADPTALSATTTPTAPLPSVDLAWTDNANNESGYRIERCTGDACVNFTTLTDLAPDVTSYQDAQAAFDVVYRYRVQALRAGGSGGGSGYSNVAEDNTIRSAVPVDLAAVSITNTRVDLSWTDNSTNEFGFRIERCEGVGCGTFTQIAQVPANQATYSDATVPAGETVTYRVRSYNGAAASDPSDLATVTANLPAIVTGVAVVQASAAPSVQLTWTFPTEPVLEFELLRCAGAGCTPTVVSAFVAGDFAEYEDTGVVLNEVYRYAVVAKNASGSAPASDIVEVNTNVPATVGDLAAQIASPTQVLISFTPVPDAQGYELSRCAGDCVTTPTYSVLGTLSIGTYIDETVVLGETYSYRLVSTAVVGNSAPSAPVTLAFAVPASLTGLSATTASATQVDLTWTNIADNATNIRIERCAGVDCELVPANFTTTGIASGVATSFSDLNAVAGESYSYRVITYNQAGDAAAFSNIVTATTDVPQTPTVFFATTVNAARIDLGWTNPGAGEDGFRIERCDPASCTFAQIAEIPAGSTTYEDNAVTGGAAYRYRVRAFNAAGNSGYSDEAEANTLPPSDPASLQVAPASPTETQLAWTHPADNNTFQYLVERCEGAACNTFAEVGVVSAPTTTFTDNSLTTGSTYRYRISAVNAADTSATSNEAEVALVTPANPDFGPLTSLSPTSIQVEWVDKSDNETGFTVLRCNDYPGCGDIVVAGVVGADTAVFVDSLLTPGREYQYQVIASNLVGTSAVFGLGTAITPILPATGLTATLTGVPSADLEWSADFAGVATVEISRCTGVGCTVFTPLTTVAPGTTTYQDASVVVGETYGYSIALFSAFTQSPPSNVATAAVLVPDAPTNVSVVATTATTTRLFWSYTPGIETGFRVERCLGVGCSFTEIADLPPAARQFDDAVGDVNESITYRVRAYNVVGGGPAATDVVLSVALPSAPIDLIATPIFSTRVDLSWGVLDANAVGYTVSRCEGSGCEAVEENFTVLGSVDAPTLGFSDNAAAAGTEYTYRVRAYTGLGESSWSAVATTITSVPAAPFGFLAEVVTANNVQLTWNNPATNALGIRVERCTGLDCGLNPDNFAELLVLPPNAVNANDVTTLANTTYSYRIRSVNNIGSSFSDVSTVNTDLPAAVTDLVATPLSGVEVQLTWTDNATNETGFFIQRCSGGPGCTFTPLLAVPANSTGYVDAAAPFGQVHQYRVIAANAAGQTPSAVDATASTVLDAPVQARAFTLARQAIRFRWTHDSPIESGYQIQICSGEDCELTESNFVNLDVVAANDSSYVNTGLAPNTRYAYRVRAVTNGGVSAWSPLNVEPGLGQLPFARTPLQISSGAANLVSDPVSRAERHYVINVPANTPQLTVTLAGAGGDADMYVRRGAVAVVGTGFQASDTLCVPFTGGPETCTFTNPTPGDWYIMLQAFSPYTNETLTATVAPSVFVMQTCGASGAFGPTQAQCTAAYAGGNTAVTVVNGVQNWTVPHTGRYRIYARGAAGASASAGFVGGRGALMQGDFNLNAGQVLSIAVGQAGSASTGSNGGGGGGSFVVRAGVPLIVGGGGGGMRTDATQVGCDASITTFATAGSGTTGTGWACPVKSTEEGQGGLLTSTFYFGAGGAGFYGNGADDFYTGGILIGTGGRSWAAGLIGGTGQNQATCTTVGNGPGIGGFGGGGAGHGCFGGGGGGGFSGGDGGWIAGGGGSLNTGDNAVNTPGVGTTNGIVLVQYIGPAL